MTKENLFYTTVLLAVYFSARHPPRQDFNLQMAVPPYYNNTKDDGISSPILGVQLRMMQRRIDNVSADGLETSGIQNGQKLTTKHLLLIMQQTP